MKILSLNTWGGRSGRDAQLDFFHRMKGEVDIFCLQEVWSAPYEHYEGIHAGGLPIDHSTVMTDGLGRITSILNDHEYFFNPHFGDNYGLLMLVRKRIEIQGLGEIWVHREKGFIPEGDIGLHARNLQYAHIEIDDKKYTVCNFHGLWNGKGKGDSDERIVQSERIIQFLQPYQSTSVVVGDFNLLPNTKSIALFEQGGYQNLIRDYKIASTRTSFYPKPEKHADYAFVGREISIKNFNVLPDEVSDHAALLLEIV